MSVKVYTYDDPTSLFQQNQLDLNNTIHICATSNMAGAIRNQTEAHEINSAVLSMNEFNKIILKEWFSEETILAQYLELTDYLEELNIPDQRILHTYKRNKDELLETLRLLYFVGTNPKTLYDVIQTDNFSKKESLLPNLYVWFSNLDSNKLYLKSSLSSSSDLIKKIEDKKKVHLNSETSIIFHGFYFITPEQQKVMEYVKKIGFDIAFFHYYKNNYPASFSFIQKFINEDYGWLNYPDWEKMPSNNEIHLGDAFSSMFEGEDITVTHSENVKRYEFSNFTDFLSHAEKYAYIDKEESNKKDKIIMATNSQYMNNRMQEFYPEKYKNYRNFLKYPIGYLLVQLHEMWDAEGQKLLADNEHIMKILSSGYFFFDNDEDYLAAVYKEIHIFFSQCQSRSEWEEQFDKLLDIRMSIEESFYNASSKVDKFHVDFDLDVNESPFSYLPYLSVSSDNIKKVKDKVEAIFNLAKDLFSDEAKDIDLKEHFEKLLNIVNNTRSLRGLDAEDESILIDLTNKLNQQVNVKEVNKDYLNEAVQFYLSGTANEDDEELVEPLINIDGELFRNRAIHITGLDEKGLPYGEYSLPWPLSELLIEKLAIDNKYLKLLVYRNESVVHMTRYLLHLMFKQINKVEISHIKNYEDNSNLQRSFYIKLMEDYIKKIDYSTEIDLSAESVLMGESETYNISHYSLDKRAEFVHHPNRLFYSKASKQTSYDEPFQQQFVLSSLATYLLINNERSIVESFLIEIFPQFDSLFIELSVEAAESYAGRRQSSFGEKNIGVSDHRKLFIFPGFKWSENRNDELNIDELYSQAKSVLEVSDQDFPNNEIYRSYIYPYHNIEFPEGFEGGNDDK